MKPTLLSGLFTIVLCTSFTSSLTAQQRYAFHAEDYVSTDNSRAPQSAFSYDETANTFTIKASGSNNIAFKMDKSKVDGKYYITGNQKYYVIEGTKLKSSPSTSSYVWWFNGANNNSQEAATYHFTTDAGTTLAVWNIASNSVMKSNMDFTQERITISSNGRDFINAQGLTSSSTSSTISRVDYLERYGLAALYPCTWTKLGYDAQSLTSEIKEVLATRITESKERLQHGKSEELSEALATAQQVYEALTDSDYLQAYETLHKLEVAEFDSKMIVNVSQAEQIPGGLHLTNGDGMHTYVLFYNDNIVRILKSYSPLAEIDKLSMSVIQEYDPNITLTCDTTDAEKITIQSATVTIAINRETGQLTATRADGSSLLAEQAGGTTFTSKKDGQFDSYTIRNTFDLDPDEYLFGLGQIQDGDLNRRNHNIHLEQDNTKVCIPYLQSSKNYGLFWDNYSPTTYNDDAEGMYFESTGTEIDYYIINGTNSEDVTAETRWLTGDAPLMPLWNFGLYQSKERYKSATETMNVIREYRKRQVPIDCVVQDWQYWGEENDHRYWNSLYFLNKTYFSNYQEMIDDIHQNNAHLLISIWANFGTETPAYKELNPIGRMIPAESYPWGNGVEPYDVWSSTARDVYWKHLYAGLVSHGVDAYWMDSTEPDYQQHSESELDYLSECGRTWRTMRNSFVLGQISGVYDHHRATQATDDVLAQKRVSILTRSGFVGQQRYAANTWSGDIWASWETLQKQIPAALNFTACGIPYWNNDNGAFFVGYSWGNHGPFDDGSYRNLYLRWTQFSTFTGMLRFHGSGHNSEIWQLGEPEDADGGYNQLLKYIRMRYSLLPYIYSQSWQITKNHKSLMTALPLAFNADRNTYDQKYQYMFGDAFMVCPVVNEGQTISQNYLPAGTNWIDFWTGEELQGGQTHTKQANLDIIPLYVKAGSIVPWGPEVQYSTEKPWDNLEIRVYPGADGDFVLYEDENDNYNYEQGAYTEIPMHWDDASHTLTIGARRGAGFTGMLQERTFNIVLVNGLRGTGDAHSTRFSATLQYDGQEQSVTINEDFQSEIKEDITEQYIKNPSFEAENTTFSGRAPKNWTTSVTTSWYGVNAGGGSGDPAATDGKYIFGVWDSSNAKKARISQNITLPQGDYRLTVDMHASSRIGQSRLGHQQLFVDEQTALFRDQISSTGIGDNVPLQTIQLNFTLDAEKSVTIGVDTKDAEVETWYKIDNFRLYRITRKASLNGETEDAITEVKPSNTGSCGNGGIYDLSGRRVTSPTHGVYIENGKKIIRI